MLYRDGTTHVIFEPQDFIARGWAALVPNPQVNLTRFHGVLGPNNQHRARVTPASFESSERPLPWRNTSNAEQRAKGAFGSGTDFAEALILSSDVGITDFDE